ncbi:hypothetical protein HF324_02295 [Chitinophaga oryzae]|uniref:VCBS repeat-containing protein n=1 Tax=Chitinophaga oryzae TaxID=2725414 RepID=A0AAE7D548_9BACT|nr:hypothetical protein [Chitinophaga oryzae]QJB30238.1 hypothetical protein HF329_02535 [Chitinophaga oryzae]QJB36746.1 hypothetical protein HF324_02295 [Chitinophaga oryzae]
MKYLLLLILLPIAVHAQTADTRPPFIPAGYQKIAEAAGDLDKDGKDELVLVYDTEPDKNDDFERILYICRYTDGKPGLWRKKVLSVLPAHSMPQYTRLQDLKIRRNCIILKQEEFPGGRNLTLYTHIFRFQQNDWYLIGSKTSLNTNCYGAQISEVNFSTGDVVVAFEPDGGCDGEDNPQPAKSRRQYKHTFTTLPLLDQLKFGENSLKIPGCKETIYY